VSQILSSPGTIATMLEKILDLAFQILPVDRAAVLLAGEGGALVPRVVRARTPLGPGEMIWSQSIVDWVRERGTAALFADAQADPRLDRSRSVVRGAIVASMCAPLRTRESVLGVLYVDSVSARRPLAADDLELFTAFANQAAIALENSILHERVAEEAALRGRLLRFFPPKAIKRIVEAKGSVPVVEAEVTALFCDISGFTALSERRSPREVLELLNEYFPAMSDVVFRHEGTLEKYIGDALLAVWGVPFAQEDDADRAVSAAVEMQRAVRGRSFGIHVGLHTGRVAAGNVGSDHYLQYATIGDTTNIASRLCSVAGEGEIVISDATLAKLRSPPRVELVGPVALRGREAPIGVHRVLWGP
jgi:adenylate cyclase